MVKELKNGIFVPLPCFFFENEEIDYESYAKHVKSVCKHGIMPVVSGSMGEAIHLSREDRIKLIETARTALDEEGLEEVAIMAGAGGGSTRQTIIFANDAAKAGADHLLVVPPGYYAGSLTEKSLKKFYLDIARESPLPVLIYNFPAVAGGINMSSDLIQEIALNSDNIVGVKLTCASVAKLGRIAQTTRSYSERLTGRNFVTLAGFIDFLLPSMSVGGNGSITGVPNFAPKTCQKLWNMCNLPLTPENLEEINKLNLIVSRADSTASNANIPGMKSLLHQLYGYEPYVRGPLLAASTEQAKSFFNSKSIRDILAYENNL